MHAVDIGEFALAGQPCSWHLARASGGMRSPQGNIVPPNRTPPFSNPMNTFMYEAFVTAFIIYFVVIDPVGNAPIFLAVTQHQNRARKLRTALEGALVATMIMLFFKLFGRWVLAYMNISEAAFRIASGIILFLVALDMLSARRQQRKREVSTSDDEAGEPDNVALFPLATPLLAGPSAIM